YFLCRAAGGDELSRPGLVFGAERGRRRRGGVVDCSAISTLAVDNLERALESNRRIRVRGNQGGGKGRDGLTKPKGPRIRARAGSPRDRDQVGRILKARKTEDSPAAPNEIDFYQVDTRTVKAQPLLPELLSRFARLIRRRNDFD